MTSDKKHILVLPRWYPNKSNDQLGIFIARQVELMQNDFRFTIVYAQGIPDLNSKFDLVVDQRGNIDCFIVYFRQSTGTFRKLTNFIRYRKAVRMGLNKCQSKIDLCHIHVPYRTAGPAIKLNKKKNIPYLITEHWSGHLNGQYKAKNFLDKLIYRRVLKRSAKISTVSVSLQKAFKSNTGFDSIHIPNFIEQTTSTLQTNSNKIEILSVADLIDEIKNISGILIAYRGILKSHDNLHLTLIGGGPDEGKLKQLITELNFPKDSLTIAGRQNHEAVLAAMQNCNFYICNSRFETFGMTVAEALLAGKPAICTRCGGPNEFITPSNGIQIDPAPIGQLEVAPLEKAIEEMIKTYKSFDSDKISREIESKFGRKAVRAKWLDFYTL